MSGLTATPSSAGLHFTHFYCLQIAHEYPAVPDSRGLEVETVEIEDRPESTESWLGDGKATRSGQGGKEATLNNGNVTKNPL